jgi:hypothetical protein
MGGDVAAAQHATADVELEDRLHRWRRRAARGANNGVDRGHRLLDTERGGRRRACRRRLPRPVDELGSEQRPALVAGGAVQL